MDLVDKPRKTIAEAKRLLGVSPVPTSVREPQSIRKLLRAIVSVHPQSLHALARELPSFRASICRGIVSQAAFASGLVGALPLAISDLLPISAIQVGMLLKIARAHGFRINRARARELLPLLGAGLLVREGCHRLQEWLPDQSKLLSVTVGGTWTYLIGLAAVEYFDRLCRGGDDGLLASEEVAHE
jgi:GTP-binding protein Era